MNALVLIVVAVAAFQGQAVKLTVPSEADLRSVTIEWNDRVKPFARDEDGWFTVIGVDLGAKPGEHTADLLFTYTDGRTTRVVRTITVQAKEYPTTSLTVAPKYVELSTENQERTARERKEIGAAYWKMTPEAYWTEPFAVPIPGITGGRNFGHRRIFNDQPRAPHSGADLTATTGTEIHASNRGKVILAKNLFFSGNAVFIDHGLGVFTVYLHLSEILVAPGAMVEKGEVVGLAGATGRVTGPHLHWGARIQKARVDPFSLLEWQL